MFLNKLIDIGSVKTGTKRVLEFYFTDMGKITSITSSCGCTNEGITYTSGTSEGKIFVTYKAGDIPNQLKKENRYAIKKIITVLSIAPDGLQVVDELIITGTVIGK